MGINILIIGGGFVTAVLTPSILHAVITGKSEASGVKVITNAIAIGCILAGVLNGHP